MASACSKLLVLKRHLPLALSLIPACGRTLVLRASVRRTFLRSCIKSSPSVPRPCPGYSFLQLSRRSQPVLSLTQRERHVFKRHMSFPATWFHEQNEGVHRGNALHQRPKARRCLAGAASKHGGSQHALLAHLKNVRLRPVEVATQGPLEETKEDIEEEEEDPPGDVLEDGLGEVVQSRPTSFVLPTNISHDKARVKHAEFVKSSADVSQCPPGNRPEFALVGRSNVGKSSLINMLVNRKELAQTSKKPGKTQLINHYLINNSWYLVDLPGYGYANAPTTVRTDWNNFTKDYFLKRDTLVAVCMLVDASIPPQPIDLECANWLGRNKIPLTVVFTKCDKRKKKKAGGKRPEENVKDFERQLADFYAEPPPWVMTSSANGTGKMELLVHLAQLRTFWRS